MAECAWITLVFYRKRIAVDHCTTECTGLHAAKKATRFEALEPLRQAVRDYCGGFRAGAAAGVRNRHDHGSQYLSDDAL